MTPFDHRSQLAAKDAEIAELKARIGDLERLVLPETTFPIGWGLTNKESELLALLYGRERLRTSLAMEVLYGDRYDPPQDKTIQVYVSKLRRKLRPMGIAIDSVWGVGYVLPDEARETIRQAIEHKARPR